MTLGELILELMEAASSPSVETRATKLEADIIIALPHQSFYVKRISRIEFHRTPGREADVALIRIAPDGKL